MGAPTNSNNSGVYLLWLYLPDAQSITIGKLGEFFFEAGVYAYCGSAQRYLNQRIARHSRREKNLHWHIDYFRAMAHYLGHVVFYNQPKAKECDLARELLRIPGSFCPVTGFGSSDCSCISHFISVPLAEPKGF